MPGTTILEKKRPAGTGSAGPTPPAVLTSVDAGRACGPIGASANQDGGRHGRRGSATSPKNVTDPRRNPDTRFAAEDDGGRGIGAVLAGHDGRRGLCESAMPWLASYV